jgi:4-hydroxybenzoate polyprenyltransferase
MVVLAALSYMTINILYSFKLKNTPIIDIFCVASGFVIRAVAGALAVKASASAWLLLCTSLGALWLAAEKRRQELKLADSGGSHRKVLADYSVSIVTRMESIIAPSLLSSYAMYSFNSPHGHWMMITVPIVLYGMMRYQMLSERGSSTGAPEDVFWKDRPIQLTIALWLLACAFVIYGSPAAQMAYYGKLIDSLKFW